MRRFWLALLATCMTAAAGAAPLTDAEFVALCGGAEHREHCGRLVEAEQLKRNPGLGERLDKRLLLRMPNGAVREFLDREGSADAGMPDRNITLWDFNPRNDFVTLWVQRGETSRYWLMNRESGLVVDLPAEPIPSPDNLRFAVADFCEQTCSNELVLWEVQIHRLRRARTLQPIPAWADADVRWKDRSTLAIEAKRTGPAGPTMNYFEIDLGDGRWKFDD